ncbi:MAG TPA: hypothetical protein VKY41_04565 [Xanthomarina sp.]|nr:hypothetical protein [Xanthomarina sp.]
MSKTITLFFIFVFSIAYSQQTSRDIVAKTQVNVLFIGNSLTYSNNLPELVKEMAAQEGIEMNYKMMAFPNYSIQDHWNVGKAQKLIAKKKYDFVIIQQGPSSQVNGRNMLVEYGKKFNNLCKEYNTKLGYFMVWPSLSYYQTFNGVIKNYRDAARINNSILLPVGKVWKEYIDKTEDFQYYGSDGFHPSLQGSKIAAKVIVNHLFLQNKNL